MLFSSFLEEVAPHIEDDNDDGVDDDDSARISFPFIYTTRSLSTLRRISEISLRSIPAKYHQLFILTYEHNVTVNHLEKR